MSSFVIVLTTWPAEREATAFARTLIDERLAACVNILAPMTSVYRWDDGIQEAAERPLLMKTTRTRLPAR